MSETFPDPIIYKAYLHPQADRSTQPLSWDLPDLDGIRHFCARKLGWPVEETDKSLLPMLKKLENRDTQTRLDSYYLTYHDQNKFAKIRSERLRKAVQDLTKGGEKKEGAKAGKRRKKGEEKKKEDA